RWKPLARPAWLPRPPASCSSCQSRRGCTSRRASCCSRSTTTPRNKLAQASATLRKAQAAFDKADKGFALKITPTADYDSMKYDLEAQRAIVGGARLELSWTRVKAPISGVIARRQIKLGNLVQANQALFDIVDLEPLQAVLNVPERN